MITLPHCFMRSSLNGKFYQTRSNSDVSTLKDMTQKTRNLKEIHFSSGQNIPMCYSMIGPQVYQQQPNLDELQRSIPKIENETHSCVSFNVHPLRMYTLTAEHERYTCIGPKASLNLQLVSWYIQQFPREPPAARLTNVLTFLNFRPISIIHTYRIPGLTSVSQEIAKIIVPVCRSSLSPSSAIRQYPPLYEYR